MRKGGMRLRPNTSYEVRGAATSKMTSDAAGNASVMTVLDGAPRHAGPNLAKRTP
jgi:hypothetical protein